MNALCELPSCCDRRKRFKVEVEEVRCSVCYSRNRVLFDNSTAQYICAKCYDKLNMGYSTRNSQEEE